MNRVFSFFFCFVFLAGLKAQPPGPTFGGSDTDIGYTLCNTSSGGYVLAGSTRSFGEGSEDIFIVNFNKYGYLDWSKVYGGVHYDFIRSIIPVDSGYVATGTTWDGGTIRDDIYLLSLDHFGEKKYEHFFGTSSRDAGHKVIKSVNGGYLILGYSRGIEPHGDFLLIETDNQGNELWRQNYGTDLDDIAFGLRQDDEGNIFIFGSVGSFYYDVHYNFHNHDADMVLIKTNSLGNELWRKIYGGEGHDLGYDIQFAPDGGSYLFGSSQSYGSGSFDMLLIKVDESGNEEWHQVFGGEDYEYGLSMDINTQGDLFLFGSTKSYGLDGSADYYLIKSNAHGEIIWETIIGGADADFGKQVIATSDSGCALIGSTESYGEGRSDLMLVKLDENGFIENLLNGFTLSEALSNPIYPNPTPGIGRIKLPLGMLSKYKLDILTINGNPVGSFTLQDPTYEFDVSGFSAGIYIYLLYEEGQKEKPITGKLIIQ